MTFTHCTGDTYLVTGLYYQSERRFRIETSSPQHVLGINLWRGRVWRRPAGTKRRIKIKEVFN